MTEQDLDLATEITADPSWKWRNGMRYLVDEASHGRLSAGMQPPPGARPDLTDPATAGALLALLDDMEILVDVARERPEWIVAIDTDEGLKGWVGDTLGEAAGWALLAAWGRL